MKKRLLQEVLDAYNALKHKFFMGIATDEDMEDIQDLSLYLQQRGVPI